MKKVFAIVAVLALALTAFVAVGLAIQGVTPDEPTARPTPSPTTPPPASVTEAPESGLAGFYSQRIDWQPCETNTDQDCGTLTVPIDYADAEGDTIDLALLRVPATGARVGSMVVNPGGPGAPGTSYASGAAGLPRGTAPGLRHRGLRPARDGRVGAGRLPERQRARLLPGQRPDA